MKEKGSQFHVQAGDGFHVHDVFAMAIGKPHEQIMEGNGQDKGDNHEEQAFDIAIEREKKLFDAEADNLRFDSEREMSKTDAEEETKDSQKAHKENMVLVTVSPGKLFSKNGSLCKVSANTTAQD